MSTTPRLDPSIHPTPSTMARAVYGNSGALYASDLRTGHASGITAERARLLASPSAALDLLCVAIGENPVLAATVRDLVTPHLPPVKP